MQFSENQIVDNWIINSLEHIKKHISNENIKHVKHKNQKHVKLITFIHLSPKRLTTKLKKFNDKIKYVIKK